MATLPLSSGNLSEKEGACHCVEGAGRGACRAEDSGLWGQATKPLGGGGPPAGVPFVPSRPHGLQRMAPVFLGNPRSHTEGLPLGLQSQGKGLQSVPMGKGTKGSSITTPPLRHHHILPGVLVPRLLTYLLPSHPSLPTNSIQILPSLTMSPE